MPSKRRRAWRLPAAAILAAGVVAAFAGPVLGAAVSAAAPEAAGPRGPEVAEARRVLDAAGVKGGLVVHLGCGDGRLTAALRAGEAYLVHGLDADAANVEQARAHLASLGLYGPVSVEALAGDRLPYVDNLVNLVVAEDLGRVAMDEVMRVLAPGGAACLKRDGRWTATPKPRPPDIDEWTHFLHGPDNNAVARDARVGVPRAFQWVAEPRWGRSHEELASLSAAVTAGGRLFYVVDEAPLVSIRFPGEWRLVARDAFNGTLLWKRPVGPWVDHLRHFRSGPAHLPRRLVAVGETVYVTPGLAAGVVALDAATGRTLREYAGTERTEEILASDGVLYLVVGTSEASRRGGGLWARGEPDPAEFRCVMAVAADSGQVRWKRDASRENVLPLTLAVRGQRVYFQTTGGLVCLDARSGEEVWTARRPTPGRRMAFSSPTLMATDEVVLCADRDTGDTEENAPSTGSLEWAVHGWNEPGFARTAKSTLRAYAARDGKELWSAPCSEGYNSPVDLFVIGDVVWVGPAFKGYDLRSGRPAGQISTAAPRVGMAHHRCYRNKATERFIFTGKSGIEVLSLETSTWLSNNSWVRGTCQYGILPANGLLYAPPDACACFLTVKAPGLVALAPQRGASGRMPMPGAPVLEKGPLHGRPLAADPPAADDWPMYRHDPARTGTTPAPLPDAVAERWSAAVGGRLTQPAIAGGRVFVASIDAHALHALAADDGRPLWRFTAAGRIDSTPTVHKGTVLFGSADGWVYCLGAADGRLAWRFRAAPQDRRVVAYGQLESVWPVHGAVLAQNDAVYLTAGRSSYLDGGLVLYRLDPATGERLSATSLYHLDPDTGEQLVPEARFNMEGTTSDILSGDGETVYLKYFCFDRSGQRIPSGRPHLFSVTGFLGEEWFVRSYWVVGEGMPGAGWGGWADAAKAFPFGRILCVTEEAVYGYGRQVISAGAVGHRADAYHLYALDRRAAAAPPVGRADAKAPAAGAARKAPGGPPKRGLRWEDPQSLIVRALVLAGDRLAVAGPPDLGEKDPETLAFRNPDESLAGLDGRRGVRLRIVRAADGRRLSECDLGAMPVFDGMAAAGGRLYISTRDGRVLCLAAKP